VTSRGPGFSRFAAIDIGTNSVLLLVVERRNGLLYPVVDRAVITRLGKGVDQTRRLAPDSIASTLECLQSYATELRALEVRAVQVVGTSALRDASGADAFLELAERTLGTRPQIVSGTEEAQLSFSGAVSGLKVPKSATVFDVGGGSTEIIAGNAEPGAIEIRSALSVNVGAVRLHERYIRSDPPSREELLRVREDVRHQLPTVTPYCKHSVIGVGGTVTTLLAMAKQLVPYDGAQVHGAELSLSQLDHWLLSLSGLSIDERRKIAGLEPRRADVITVGAAIVLEVMKWLSVDAITVSDRGVRWGLVEKAASEYV